MATKKQTSRCYAETNGVTPIVTPTDQERAEQLVTSWVSQLNVGQRPSAWHTKQLEARVVAHFNEVRGDERRRM